MPSADWLIERYLTMSGRSERDIDFYVSLAYFKLATIAEGVHTRYRAGQTVGPGFGQVGRAVEPRHDAAKKHRHWNPRGDNHAHRSHP